MRSESEEIGVGELVELVRRHWRLIIGLGLLFAVIAAVQAVRVPVVYVATARLFVEPVDEARDGNLIEAYRAMLQSRSTIQKTAERVGDAVDAAYWQRADSNLTAKVEVPATKDGAILALGAHGPTAALAAEIANTWAQVFIEQSRSMFVERADSTETALQAERSSALGELTSVENARLERLRRHQDLEDEAWTKWEKLLAEDTRRAAAGAAAFQTETRRIMDDVVHRQFPDILTSESGSGDASFTLGVLALVSARDHLASTPRVLTLEKAAGDETFAEMLAAGTPASGFDGTIRDQQLDPLFDRLALRALEYEQNLLRLAGSRLDAVSTLLEELKEVQLDRAAGLATLLADQASRQRALRRQQNRELKDLEWQRNSFLAEYNRDLERLRDLDQKLNGWINRSVVSGSLDQLGVVNMESPAIGLPKPVPRQINLKTFSAGLLGCVFGLMIALMRPRRPVPTAEG